MTRSVKAKLSNWFTLLLAITFFVVVLATVLPSLLSPLTLVYLPPPPPPLSPSPALSHILSPSLTHIRRFMKRKQTFREVCLISNETLFLPVIIFFIKICFQWIFHELSLVSPLRCKITSRATEVTRNAFTTFEEMTEVLHTNFIENAIFFSLYNMNSSANREAYLLDNFRDIKRKSIVHNREHQK